MANSIGRWIEAGLLALVALGLVLAGGSSLHRSLLDGLSVSAGWTAHSNVISSMLLAYGVFTGLLSLTSIASMKYRRRTLAARSVSFLLSLATELRSVFRWAYQSVKGYGPSLWLAATVILAVTIRCWFIKEPMRYDEVYTFHHFANSDLASLFAYTFPNNHILNTLLVRVSTAIFGGLPVSIRLPALLAGICAVPAIFCICRLLVGEKAGYLASALATVFPYLVLYGALARGYSLVVLFSLCLAILGLRRALYPSPAVSFLISLVAALGMLAMPSFLFAVVGLYVWIAILSLLKRHGLRNVLTGFLIPCGLMTTLLSAIFYTPTIIVTGGIQALLHTRFITNLPWQRFLHRLPGHLSETFSVLSRDVPTYLFLLLAVLIAVGVLAEMRRKRWELPLLLPALIGGALIVLFFKHAIPYPRTWIYLLPFPFILADLGFARLSEKMHRPVLLSLRSVTLVWAVSWGVFLMSRDFMASYPEGGHFPEAPAVADFLAREMKPGDRISVVNPANYPVFFYLRCRDVPFDRLCESDSARRFFIVKKDGYSLADLTDKSPEKVWEMGNAAIYVHPLSDQ